uniref:Large ribosomal subunit protein uL3m n=1 Tax=Plectus sambesii TaxID=2011161 RepID=A0A914W7E1_9BILA
MLRITTSFFCQHATASASVTVSGLAPLNVTLVQKRGTRRTTTPARWLPKKIETYSHEQLTPENEAFLKQTATSRVYSPLKDEPWERGTWTESSKRTGIIAQKIGVIPQWLTSGERTLTTMLYVPENHVISYTDPETWFRNSLEGKKKAYNRMPRAAKLTVGAINADPRKLSAAYRGLFDRHGLPPKQHLASFVVSEDAKLQPGTQLFATHFKIGQWVDCTAKTIDWGFQGVMHRWGMRGQPESSGTTKAHRRVGSVGSTSDARIWPGKRLPGHMGWEWRSTRGVRIFRINVKEQVIYIRGCGVPGEIGEFVLIKDSYCEGKEVKDPYFPTHYPSEETESLPEEYLFDWLQDFQQPSIQFEEVTTKSTQRDKTVKKQAKVKKR